MANEPTFRARLTPEVDNLVRTFRAAVDAFIDQTSKLQNDLAAARAEIDFLRNQHSHAGVLPTHLSHAQQQESQLPFTSHHNHPPTPSDFGAQASTREHPLPGTGSELPQPNSEHTLPNLPFAVPGGWAISHGAPMAKPVALPQPGPPLPLQLPLAGGIEGLPPGWDSGGHGHVFHAPASGDAGEGCQLPAVHRPPVSDPQLEIQDGRIMDPMCASATPEAPTHLLVRAGSNETQGSEWGGGEGAGWMGKVKVNVGGLAGKKRAPPESEEARARRPRFWSRIEHQRFLEALAMHHDTRFGPGTGSKADGSRVSVGLGHGVAERVAAHVGTRTVAQVRSHAQKHFLKLSRFQQEGGAAKSENAIDDDVELDGGKVEN
mmetsp:Transcript_47554/g.95129  ORF Transcript_47554/g.95129 Transcript_47554/m.95129 type:complete len:376 (+) Transcript_47554:373-1500(+)